MRTRTSPRNQEILWRSLGGTRPVPPKKLPISRVKPVFDWTSNKFVDPTDASYLDRLGSASARKYAPVITRQAADAGISLPLPDQDVEVLLEQTIAGLVKEKKINWDHTPTDRRQVFVTAWATEMVRQGLRA